MALETYYTREQMREVKYLLTHRYLLHAKLEVLDTDHNFAGDISSRMITGQVDVDADSEITRSLKLDLLDPSNSLGFDFGDPDKGTLYMSRMIRATYCIGHPRYPGRWYEFPVFTGPVTKVSRDGLILQLECQGKEALMNSPHWKQRSFLDNSSRWYIMYRLAAEAGEQHTKYFSYNLGRVRSKFVAGTDSNPMADIRKLAQGVDVQVFYNGLGELIHRKRSGKSRFKFDEDTLVTAPKVGYDMSEFFNAVHVIGGKPPGKGKKKKNVSVRVISRRTLFKLFRGGVKSLRPVTIEDDGIRSKKEAKAVAKRILKRSAQESIEVSAESVVIPWLEEGDFVTFQRKNSHTKGRLNKFSIPLEAGGVMAIGFNKRVKPSKLARRVRAK